MFIFFGFASLLFLAAYFFLKHESFGSLSKGDRLRRVLSSTHFKEGKFQNLSFTPDLAEGVKYYTLLRDFIFRKEPGNTPHVPLPSVKTDLLNLKIDEHVLVWFGHSSYFMQIDGKRFLVDPVLSGSASPVAFTTRAFKGSDIYSVDDLPEIDYLLILHDHWDHLDHKTIVKLRSQVRRVITGLGTGAHLQRWGYSPSMIIEEDWNKQIALSDGFVIDTVPARHFSGRGLKRNQSLWMSFVLTTPTMKIFIGGDSGYDTHFKEIGKQHGPFDLAILECGQYHPYWKYIHMLPNEIPIAANDLGAKTLLPVHWAKFSLALHAWNDPVVQFSKHASGSGLHFVTPMIGEKLDLRNLAHFKNDWWKT
jgi:L-ascorbate metabolism protein UlaG (beta-lactamase superfamily)